jgi:hypothetical protein
MVIMDKIMVVVGRMSCLALRAHSAAQTAAIKVEICRIVKVLTKDSGIQRAILNGSPSPKTSTHHNHQ